MSPPSVKSSIGHETPRGVTAAVLLASGLIAAPEARSAIPARPPNAADHVRAGVVRELAPATRVDVTTANVLVRLGPRKARADIRRATRASTIVAVQEMWLRSAARMAPPGWAAFQPNRPRPTCRGNAILWDRSVWRPVNRYARVVNRSAIDNPARCATVVVLANRRTGLRLPIVGVHMLPHVEIAGRPRPLPYRISSYHAALDQVVALATRIRAARGRVLVAGDWNVDYPADRRVVARPFPYRHLWRRFDTHWAKLPMTRPTHGSRRIDAVWWSERGFRPIDSDTISRTYSDHAFVRVTLAAR